MTGGQGLAERTVRFAALGTTAAMLVADPAATADAEAVLRSEIDAVDRACSRFRADSDLTAINDGAGRPVTVTALAVEAVNVALRAARLTDGAVDPTVGAALQVLGYDRDFAEVRPSGPPLRLSVRPAPGWRLVRVDARAGTVTVPRGVSLDLGATAKALCADRAARAIAERTGSGVLVGLGGDLATSGSAPPGGWPVRVADVHSAGPDAPGQDIALRTGGLATSGTAARRWKRGGQALHHLVDPRTGRPAEEFWRTASVAAASCVDANIASTAAIVLGAAAPQWLAERNLPARLVAPDGTVTLVAGWPDPLDPTPS
jgi:thiamine biosynthesis lipoprotein ApbE